MISYLFRLNEGADIDLAKEELASIGLLHLYTIEDDASGEILLGGMAKKKLKINSLAHSLLAESKEADIDWSEQWSQFAQDFHDGKAHIDLTPYGAPSTLLLHPGPGFGDLSHPTTRLMLELMQDRIRGQSVLDIGCGSGILTLAALKLGAASALGIDIDPAALNHARENNQLNQLFAQFSRRTPKSHTHGITLMNMILPEQKMVMSKYVPQPNLWIVSGILAEQRSDYLKLVKNWSWNLVEERGKSDWMGFVFEVRM